MTPHSNDAASAVQMAAALARPRRELEGAFLAVGGHLLEASELLAGLKATFDALPETLEGADAQDAAHRLAAIAEAAQEIARDQGLSRGPVDDLVQAAAAVERPLTDLAATVRAIGIVALNARVAAAYVADGDDLSVFTTDVATLAKQAAAVVSDFLQDHQRLVGSLMRARDTQQGFDASHGETLPQVAERLRNTVAAVGGRREASAVAGSEVGRAAKAIGEGVSAAVFALQVGDITRQRLEHVEEAFRRVASHVAGPSAFAILVRKLQEKQLEGTMADLQGETAAIQRSLRELRSESSRMVASGLTVAQTDPRDAESFLAGLSRQVRQVLGLLVGYQQAGASLEGSVAEATHSARKLGDQIGAVQRLEAEMRIISLNMALRCGRLGIEGRTLSVIAQELSSLARSTAACAEAVIAQLGKVVEVADRMSEATSNDDKVERMEGEACAALESLMHMDGAISAAVSQLSEGGARVSRLLEQAEAALSQQSSIAVGIGQTLPELRGMIARDEASATPLALDETASEALAALRKIYTMESERRLHDEVVQHSAGPAFAKAS